MVSERGQRFEDISLLVFDELVVEVTSFDARAVTVIPSRRLSRETRSCGNSSQWRLQRKRSMVLKTFQFASSENQKDEKSVKRILFSKDFTRKESDFAC